MDSEIEELRRQLAVFRTFFSSLISFQERTSEIQSLTTALNSKKLQKTVKEDKLGLVHTERTNYGSQKDEEIKGFAYELQLTYVM